MKKTGFTLAEVLITLGIIGIVAAIVMPTLIFDNQKNIIEAKVGQTYSTLAQAAEMSEIDNSKIEYWDTSLNSQPFFEKYILPYLKGASYCGSGNNAANTEKCGMGVSTYGVSYTLNNGTTVSFVSAAQRQARAGDLGSIIVDGNGAEGPNALGMDAHYFELRDDGFQPFAAGLGISREDILKGTTVNLEGKNETVACKLDKTDDDDAFYRHGCTLLFVMDGMTFKDDYPWD